MELVSKILQGSTLLFGFITAMSMYFFGVDDKRERLWEKVMDVGAICMLCSMFGAVFILFILSF